MQNIRRTGYALAAVATLVASTLSLVAPLGVKAAPTLTVSPTSGPVGTQGRASGDGYADGEIVLLLWHNPGRGSFELARARATPSGHVDFPQFTVPDQNDLGPITPGPYDIWTSGDVSGGSWQTGARVVFQVTGSTAPSGPASTVTRTPSITPNVTNTLTPSPTIPPPLVCVGAGALVTPSSVAPGGRVTFVAGAFAPGSQVEARIIDPSPNLPRVISLIADASCQVIAMIDILPTDLPGSYTVMATGSGPNREPVQKTAPYTVVGTPTPTPTATATPSVTPTRTSTATATVTLTPRPCPEDSPHVNPGIFSGGCLNYNDFVAEQVTLFLHHLDDTCFTRPTTTGRPLVSLGSPGIYQQAAHDVVFVIRANLEENAVWTGPGLFGIGRPYITLKVAPEQGWPATSNLADPRGAAWHELTHHIEYQNGDYDREGSGRRVFNERNAYYMHRLAETLDDLAIWDRRGQNQPLSSDNMRRFKEIFDTWPTYGGKVEDPPRSGNFYDVDPPDPRLTLWTGFIAEKMPVLRRYESGDCGPHLQLAATTYLGIGVDVPSIYDAEQPDVPVLGPMPGESPGSGDDGSEQPGVPLGE